MTYFFSERGAFRTDDIHNTDVALNYSIPFGHAEVFAQGEVVNVFDRQELVTTNTSINTNIRAFNPMTETAVECPQGLTRAQCEAQFPVVPGQPNFGFWQKNASFGKGTLAGNFQTPRTYRVSVGVKF